MKRSLVVIGLWLTLVFSLILTAYAQAAPKEVRVYVVYGQGGAITSGGMVSFASTLRKYKHLNVTTHTWKNPGVIVNSINRMPADTPIVIIGYSLGANDTTWITGNVPHRRIALVVAYDPSIYGYIYPRTPNIDRFLLYHNQGSFGFGHAIIPGLGIERYDVNTSHLLVDYNSALHARTLEAVKKVRSDNGL